MIGAGPGYSAKPGVEPPGGHLPNKVGLPGLPERQVQTKSARP